MRWVLFAARKLWQFPMLQQKMSALYFQRADSGTSASVLCGTRGHSAVGAIVYDTPQDKVLVSLL